MSRRLNVTVDEAGMDDTPLLAVEDRIRNQPTRAPIIWTNFCKVDSKALLIMSAFSGEKCWDTNLQFHGTDHVYDNCLVCIMEFSRA